MYVRSALQSTIWQSLTTDSRQLPYELLWVRVGCVFVCAVYHPPRPPYTDESLINYFDICVTELLHDYPSSLVVLAGDFNQLQNRDIIECTGFTQLVSQPTRGANILDRIYVSDTQYSTVRVMHSVVRSDHKAIVAYADHQPVCGKTSVKKTYRRVTPSQHAAFLQYISTIEIEPSLPQIDHTNVQAEFDQFYDISLGLLNAFYPERSVTVTSRDPDYVTPVIKAKLRRKNRLMRSGRVEEASAIAVQIGKDITRRSRTCLNKLEGRADSKAVWAAVRHVTKQRQQTAKVDGIDAQSLNQHYASISTDHQYSRPKYKLTAGLPDQQPVSEWRVFKFLDTLRPTATGLDRLPAWFLRLGAPVFSKPLAHLFSSSLATSIVPRQWKAASICPVQKVTAPKEHADFRPISITPVLSRILERLVVRDYIYQALLSPPLPLSISDQFAFRPTGSTTAALISILHTVTHLLETNPYVIVIALDFSKAFDSVRHATLMEKYAALDLPDNIYNWVADFFSDHSHCTRYCDQTSALQEISASIVQGSAIGPVSYVVTAADLTAVTPGNTLCKYADDTYVIIPASNVDSRAAELDNVTAWSSANNLTLNRSKSVEIVFVDKWRRQKLSPPPVLPDMERVTSLKILGVTFTNRLLMNEHVQSTISASASLLYALRVLRAHGMPETALQVVYQATVMAKVLYAASAWWGFTSASDRELKPSLVALKDVDSVMLINRQFRR